MAEFVLGVKALADELGAEVVGEALEPETYVEGRYSLQMSTKGLFVYSQAANRVGFVPFRTKGGNGAAGPMLDLRDVTCLLPRNPSVPVRFRNEDEITMIVLHWDGGPEIPESYSPLDYYKTEALFHINKDWSWAEPGVQGGSGLMYHAKIARDGTVFITRAPEEILWHATDANDFSYAVCVDATSGEGPTVAQFASLLKFVERTRARFKLTRADVRGHGELTEYGNSTECPGVQLLAWLADYRNGRL